MNFRTSISIARPVEQVWNAFVDPARLPDWQATLRSMEPVSGEPGQVGSVARFTYREGGRDIVMTETIVERRAPSVMSQRLEASMMHSTMRNQFEPAADGSTTWTLDCEINFTGLFKLMALLGPKMFTRKTEEDMRRFKALVESSAPTAR